MPVKKEFDALLKYCVGKGANVGCGNAPLGNSLGVDICPTASAASIFAPADKLPFESDSLDYVVSCASLEHIDRGPVHVLREWTRCVKVGGVVAVIVPDAEYGIWAMTGDTGRCGELCKPRLEMEHVHAFTLPALRILFEFCGLWVVEAAVIDRQPVRKERTLICAGRKSTVFK